MTRTDSTILIALLLQPHVSSGQQQTRNKAIETTLCEVVKHSVRFAGKWVRFHASFESDGLENSVLFDSKCKLGIVPYYSDQFVSRPDIQAFDRAINAGQPGTLDKRVVATFMGRFILKGQGQL